MRHKEIRLQRKHGRQIVRREHIAVHDIGAGADQPRTCVALLRVACDAVVLNQHAAKPCAIGNLRDRNRSRHTGIDMASEHVRILEINECVAVQNEYGICRGPGERHHSRASRAQWFFFDRIGKFQSLEVIAKTVADAARHVAHRQNHAPHALLSKPLQKQFEEGPITHRRKHLRDALDH